MKLFAFILTFCGLCIFYICNADWMDELIENCLGNGDEEIGPFVPSVTAGTEEFDRIVDELKHPKGRWLFPSVLVLSTVFLSASVLLQYHFHLFHGSELMDAARKFLAHFKKSGADRDEIQTILVEFLEKFKQLSGNKHDEIPVKLLWKGGTLMDSSVHCNIKDESKRQHLQRNLLRSKVLFGGKENQMVLTPSSSETSTARKMSEIRKLLESEQELERFVDEIAENYRAEMQDEKQWETPPELRRGELEKMEEAEEKEEEEEEEEERKKENQKKENRQKEIESECGIDPKLMNRIRLLESRLRLEELKNKNWINRMSRAEDILKRLNKQVEQIEETRPVGTLTGTLKITSTVTNWSPSCHPRRNMKFTLINRCPSFRLTGQTPYTSLSELIKKEIGLPTSDAWNKNLFQLPPTPQVLALPSPIVMPQSSFLSKFLCR